MHTIYRDATFITLFNSMLICIYILCLVNRPVHSADEIPKQSPLQVAQEIADFLRIENS